MDIRQPSEAVVEAATLEVQFSGQSDSKGVCEIALKSGIPLAMKELADQLENLVEPEYLGQDNAGRMERDDESELMLLERIIDMLRTGELLDPDYYVWTKSAQGN